METVLSPPLPFTFEENLLDLTSGRLCDSWKKWKKGFNIYSTACELEKKSPNIQMNILLHVIGEQCREIVDQGTDKCTTLEGVLKKLDSHFTIKKNVTVERHKFFTRAQKENETIDQYIMDLKKLAQTCEFGNLNEDLIKDRLVCGISSAAMRERLLREENLTLNKAMDICRAVIVSRAYSEDIKSEKDMVCEVNNQPSSARDEICQIRMKKTTGFAKYRGGRNDNSGGRLPPADGTRASSWRGRGRPAIRRERDRSVQLHSYTCDQCGNVHKKYECPAYGKRCLRCSRMNHFSRVCRVYQVEQSEQSESSDEEVIKSIDFCKQYDDWTVDLKINTSVINFKIDTGADVNVLPLRFLSKIGISRDDLLKTNTKLTGYSGDKINVLGKIYLKMCYKNKFYALEFKIADVTSKPVLGRETCSELDIIRRVMSVSEACNIPKVVKEYKDVFMGIGCLPGKYKIVLKDNIVPVIHAPRKLPFAIRDEVKKKLDEMVSQQIITKVEGPSDWVNSITVVKKANGDLRICLNPKELNSAIKREHFRLPTLDEIVSNLSGAKYFSTLDAGSGFWNVALDESSKYCTFNTPFGRYKFLRMPYGICSASEVFHKKMYESFGDIEGVCMYIDDLLIYAVDKKQHDEILKKVLDRCRSINLKLNKDKCKFGLDEIKYLGHRITKNGLCPDDSHLTAIKNMPVPKNRKDVERFLGLITYVGTFVSNLSDKTLPLRELLQKDIPWHWDERHDKCLNHLKTCLSKRPILQYYSMHKPIVISVDSSKSGLGAVLMQNNLPVCYASKSLTKTEQRYAQIEKELYACVFACERFNAYIYGRSDVIIETDHKPLISIIKKPIVDAPSRLQRMLLRLQRYTFKLIYKPGKHLYIADTLSRAYEQLSEVETTHIMQDEVCVVGEIASIASQYTDAQFVKLQKTTESDVELKQLQHYIMKGWPKDKNKVTGVVGRADVLACVFFLSSLLLYHGCSGRHRVWSSVVLAALSMLAKETGLTVLLFNIVFDVYRCWNPIARLSSGVKSRWRSDSLWGRVVRVLGALVLLVGVRLALLQGSLPAFSPQDNPPAFHPSFTVRLMTFCYLAAFNWWLLLCPWTLSHDWQMGSVPLVTSGWDPRNLLTCAAIITLLALSYRCIVDLELQRHSPVVVGLMLLVIPYLPASNLLVTVGFVVAERVLYIPSVGSVLLTVYGLQRACRRGPGRRRLLLLAAAALVAAGVARTQLRNRDWRTRETLLRADLAVLPHNAKLHYNFANFLKDIEQQENAIKHYKEALKLWPSYASAHNNLGTLVSGWSHAEHHFLQALKYNRDHVNAHYNLAKLYRKKNRINESLKMLERCITLEPRFIQAYLELLLITEDGEKRAILDKLLELEPTNWEHYILYGNWLKDRGLLPLSLEYYTTAMRLSFTGDTQSPERGKMLSMRATCLALRSTGQRAKMLQLVTRWHAVRGGGQPLRARARAAAAWRLRTELAGRAALYARPRPSPHAATSTCLHHSQLEISADFYVAQKHEIKDSRTILSKSELPFRDIDKVSEKVSDVKNSCQKTNEYTKKSVSISAQYKPTHNKSETGHKQKSCPLHKKKKIKDPETFTPFVSDHLIKTY